jgi:hypothetical protein
MLLEHDGNVRVGSHIGIKDCLDGGQVSAVPLVPDLEGHGFRNHRGFGSRSRGFGRGWGAGR